jgi:hypothetical protein
MAAWMLPQKRLCRFCLWSCAAHNSKPKAQAIAAEILFAAGKKIGADSAVSCADAQEMRPNSEIRLALGRWYKGEAHNDDAAFAFAARAVPAALSA